MKFTRFILLFTTVFILLANHDARASGELDPTFGVGGKVIISTLSPSWINAMAIQPDGRILVAGSRLATYDSQSPTLYQYGFVARLNVDGSLDRSFGVGGIMTETFLTHTTFSALALQPDGKIVVAGHYSEIGGCPGYRALFYRYNPDGSRDMSFANGGLKGFMFCDFGPWEYTTARMYGLAIQSDGKILGAGVGKPNGAPNFDFLTVRMNPDGSWDTSYSGDGYSLHDFANGDDEARAVAVDPVTGRIIPAGFVSNSPNFDDFALLGLTSNGLFNTGFGNFGKVTTDFFTKKDRANAVIFQPDGKIIAGGTAAAPTLPIYAMPDPRFALARYNSGGSLDTTFGSGGKVSTNLTANVDDTIYGIALQPDGKIVAAGTAGPDFAVVRYNSDGSPDSTFGLYGKVKTDFSGYADAARAVAIQTDGKIVVAGFAPNESYTDMALARYLP